MDKLTAYNMAKLKSNINWTVDKDGYRCATVGGYTVRRHILNFFIEFGWLPEYVDHIDNTPGNDWPDNLRAATASQNACNSKIRSDNTSGVKGVSWDSSRKKWRARVKVNGITQAVGRFNTIEEAAKAVKIAREDLHKDFARCD